MEALPVTTVEEIRAACPEWRTTEAIAEALGYPQGHRPRRAIHGLLKFWEGKGALDARWTDGVGTEFRASEGWRGRIQTPLAPRVIASLAEGPKTRAEIAEELGMDPDRIGSVLGDLRRRGRVDCDGKRPRPCWSLREAERWPTNRTSTRS
jgi:predicted Rossmann fold nucleotide-binding protein DprA/Smf involved in DNA uptake